MPDKALKPCAHRGCPELTRSRFCPAHQKLENQRYEKFQRDPATHKRYGRNWKAVRALYVAEHPLCELCLENGKHQPVEEVHHKIPLSAGGTHAMDNLISLCSSCHSSLEAKEGRRWG